MIERTRASVEDREFCDDPGAGFTPICTVLFFIAFFRFVSRRYVELNTICCTAHAE